MSKLSGVFEDFSDLDKIPLEDIYKWLTNRVLPHYLLNYLGNLIQYPQVVPTNREDLDIDFAILREAIHRQPHVLFSQRSKQLIIPEEFMVRFLPIQRFILTLVESMDLPEVTPVLAKKNQHLRQLTTIVAPTLQKSQNPLTVTINNQVKKISLGVIAFLPLREHQITLSFDGKKQYQISAGEMGIVLDLRKVA